MEVKNPSIKKDMLKFWIGVLVIVLLFGLYFLVSPMKRQNFACGCSSSKMSEGWRAAQRELWNKEFPVTIVQYHNNPSNDLLELVDLTRRWSNLHGYRHIFRTAPVHGQQEISPYWEKVRMINEMLPHSRAVMWVDADAAPWDATFDIDDLLAQYPDKSMICAPDPPQWDKPFMAAVFVVRNDEVGREMMRYWMSLYDEDKWVRNMDGKWTCQGEWAGPDYEQGSFTDNILYSDKYKNRIQIIPFDVLHPANLKQITKNSKFIHFGGDENKVTIHDALPVLQERMASMSDLFSSPR